MTTAPSTAVTRREPELPGQTVVIIGGSAGIGLETARRARAEGARALRARSWMPRTSTPRPGHAEIWPDKEQDIMSDTLTYQRMGTAARGQAHALFAQTMDYVAVTAGLFALGAWAGHDLAGGVGIVAFIAAFACLIGMQFAARRSVPLTVGLLGAFGLLIGLAVAPTVAYYGSMDPRALWQAGGATALFIAGFVLRRATCHTIRRGYRYP
jgi:NAD(P)-dependent dehydrogenase (short-subunit alcohol dehydrogenase family)